MRHTLTPDEALSRRRAIFTDLIARAEVGTAQLREHLLDEAATLAYLHEQITGAPLVPDLAAYPGLAQRMPHP